MTPTDTLTATQVRDFYLNGFIGLDALLTPQELEILRDVYDEWILTQKLETTQNLKDLEPKVPELRACRFRERALRIARQILGDEAVLRTEKFMYRPAGHDKETP